jgi:hypothetical protein
VWSFTRLQAAAFCHVQGTYSSRRNSHRSKSAFHFSSIPTRLPYLAVGNVAARHEGPRLARSSEARDGAGQHPVYWEAYEGAKSQAETPEKKRVVG